MKLLKCKSSCCLNWTAHWFPHIGCHSIVNYPSFSFYILVSWISGTEQPTRLTHGLLIAEETYPFFGQIHVHCPCISSKYVKKSRSSGMIHSRASRLLVRNAETGATRSNSDFLIVTFTNGENNA